MNGSATRRYSLEKIANELGVSRTTVSFVLNGKARKHKISAALEERIKKHCRKQNYSINAHAKRMRQDRVGVVGVLVHTGETIGCGNPFADYNVAEILGGIAKSAAGAGVRMCVQVLTSDLSVDSIIQQSNSREVDGFIHYGMLRDDFPRALREANVPFVAIGEGPTHGIATLSVNNYSGSFQVARHLVDKGRCRFLYFGGPPSGHLAKERRRGFLDALKSAGRDIEPEFIVNGMFSENKAYELLRRRLEDTGFDRDAIVCANDFMAIGVLRALEERGLNVPGDVSVVGADDINLSRYVKPKLTTFTRRLMELGGMSFEFLQQIINKERSHDSRITLDTSIVIRESS